MAIARTVIAATKTPCWISKRYVGPLPPPNHWSASAAKTAPPIAPAATGANASPMKCRTTRHWLAPIALRSWSSLLRAHARTRNRLVTLAIAMKKMSAPVSRKSRPVPPAPRRASTCETTRALTPRFVSGYAALKRRASRRNSSLASAIVVVDESRPKISYGRVERRSGVSRPARTGKKMSSLVKPARAGRTPTIVTVSPPTVTARPITSWLPPKRRCQKPSANTATRGVLSMSSASVNNRP